MTDNKVEFISESTVKLVDHNADDSDVAYAAWVSNFDLDDTKNMKPFNYNFNPTARAEWDSKIEGLINFLYRERHMSPFEHGMLKFYIDTPIFVAREFMRHRTFSYNETSGRYKELAPRFYLVDSDRPLVQQGKIGNYTFGPGTDEQYGSVFAATTGAYLRAWDSYQTMLGAGVAKEVARNVLPVATMTQFYVTGNPRNWMQFLTLRNDKNALKEIRDVAQRIESEFAEVMPLTYSAYKKYDYREERMELKELRAAKEAMEAEIAELKKQNRNFKSELSYAKPNRFYGESHHG